MEKITFKQLRNLTEDQARDMLEAVRWPNGVTCPRCGADRAHKLEPKTEGKTHVRPGVYFCGGCRIQFTVTVGTVMERSRISIANWIMGLYLVWSLKKGVSAQQLHRTLGLSYEAAWFMAHRIRFAMTQVPVAELATGEVEIEATHISEQHLDRYVDEFAFRYNNRKITDAERTAKALSKAGGKRLYYKKPRKA